MTEKTNLMNTFLHFCSERFEQHDSSIAQQISQSLENVAIELLRSPAVPTFANKVIPQILHQSDNQLLQLLNECVQDLPWRQAGFGKLPVQVGQSVAVVELVGPTGMYQLNNLRFGLLIQCKGVHYPKHWHAAEELYLVLEGTADWAIDKAIPTPRTPGEFIHHQTLQPHSIVTRNEPLIALWGWTGEIGGASYSV